MTILEKRRKRAALITDARTLNDKGSLGTEDSALYDAKLAEARTLKTEIEREEALTLEEADSAREIGNHQETGTREGVRVTEQRIPGQGFVNCVRALALHKGDLRGASQYAESTLHDSQVARALAAGVGTAGGFLVPTAMSQEIIEFLRPLSIVRSMGPRILPMENGNLTLPRMTGGAVASYLGENQNLPKTEQTFGQLRLIAKKLGCLVPISNDLIRFANPATDAVIREDMAAAMSQTQDLAFIRSDGSQFTPKGLKAWALPGQVFHANGTVSVTNITLDLANAVSLLRAAYVPVTTNSGGWLMSARTFTYLQSLRNPTTEAFSFPELRNPQPTLLGYKVGWTPQIPTNLNGTQSEIYFVHWSDAIIAESMQLMIDVSSEAAYYDGSTVQAAFSLDQTVIRCISQHDFGMRHDQSVAIIDQVTY